MRRTALLCTLLATLPTFAEALNYNMMSFNESASVQVTQDTMHLVLMVSESAKNRETAADAVSRRVNAVLARAKSNRALETESGNRHAVPEYDDKGKIKGWRDTATIRVKSRDFPALNKLAADSQAHASINRLYFSVSPEKRAEAVENAGNAALRSFRRRADSMSRTLGFSGYKLVEMELTQSFENPSKGFEPPALQMRPMAKMDHRERAAEVMNTEPGVQEFHQTVRGSIQMY